jgi:hypothetical protein
MVIRATGAPQTRSSTDSRECAGSGQRDQRAAKPGCRTRCASRAGRLVLPFVMTDIPS